MYLVPAKKQKQQQNGVGKAKDWASAYEEQRQAKQF